MLQDGLATGRGEVGTRREVFQSAPQARMRDTGAAGSVEDDL